MAQYFVYLDARKLKRKVIKRNMRKKKTDKDGFEDED